MLKDIFMYSTLFLSPTIIMYHLTKDLVDILVDKINTRNDLVNKVVILEEKLEQLEAKFDDFNDLKKRIYASALLMNSRRWDDDELSELEDEEDEDF